MSSSRNRMRGTDNNGDLEGDVYGGRYRAAHCPYAVVCFCFLIDTTIVGNYPIFRGNVSSNLHVLQTGTRINFNDRTRFTSFENKKNPTLVPTHSSWIVFHRCRLQLSYTRVKTCSSLIAAVVMVLIFFCVPMLYVRRAALDPTLMVC